MGHEIQELGIVHRLAVVEAILLVEADDNLVDQRVAETRDLHPGPTLDGRRTAFTVTAAGHIREGVHDAGLPHAGGRPGTDDRVTIRQAAGRHLHRDAGDVLVADDIALAVARAQRVRIDQVEDLAKVDDEAFLALANEDATLTTGAQIDAIDMILRIALIVAVEALLTDEVDRLAEASRTVALAGGVAEIRQRHRVGAATAVALLQGYLIALDAVDTLEPTGVGADAIGHGIDQRNRDRVLGAGVDGGVVDLGIETELEAQVFLRIAVVVDMDLVESVRIHREVVGATVAVLQRVIVRDESDHVIAAFLVAAEHVEVGPVHLGHFGDEGGLAVAGSARGTGGGNGRAGQQAGNKCL